MEEKIEKVNEMIWELKDLHEVFSDSLSVCIVEHADVSRLNALNEIITAKIDELENEYDDLTILVNKIIFADKL